MSLRKIRDSVESTELETAKEHLGMLSSICQHAAALAFLWMPVQAKGACAT